MTDRERAFQQSAASYGKITDRFTMNNEMQTRKAEEKKAEKI